MRRTILASLVLIPVAAAAYAATPSDPQPSAATSSASVELKAGSAGAAIVYNNPNTVREYVSTEMTKVYLDGDAGIGARQASFLGSAPATITPAYIIETKGLGLGSTLLKAMPEETEVVLQATVDQDGSVRDLHVTKAVGVFLDAKVKEAVGQYRFQPAMADNMPVSSDVTISVKIRKPE